MSKLIRWKYLLEAAKKMPSSWVEPLWDEELDRAELIEILEAAINNETLRQTS